MGNLTSLSVILSITLFIGIVARNVHQLEEIGEEEEVSLDDEDYSNGIRLYAKSSKMAIKPADRSVRIDETNGHGDEEFVLSTHLKTSTNRTSIFKKQVRLWDNGIVPFTVSSRLNMTQRGKISEAIHHFSFQTCIKVGHLLHEMLHAIGFIHEHSRPDRNQFVKIDFNNILPKWHKEFYMYDTGYVQMSRYDYLSVMHYSLEAAAINDNKPTILPLANGVNHIIGQRTNFSQTDVEDIGFLYGPICRGEVTNEIPVPIHPPPTVANHRCILLIGGRGTAEPMEYYQPTPGVDCDVNSIGRMSDDRVKGGATFSTSGCYLSQSEQVAIREAWKSDKPPMVYGLKDGSSKQLPLPYEASYLGLARSAAYSFGSTTAAVTPSRCLSCGGWSTGVYMKECYQLDANGAAWAPIESMPVQLQEAASVGLDATDYYVVGGQNGLGLFNLGRGAVKPQKQLFRYNLQVQAWFSQRPLTVGRYAAAAAALSSTEFIVCGGYKDRADCELYNAVDDRWQPMASLQEGRRYHAMVTFRGSVYALGGVRSEGSILNSVERYDRNANRWESVKAMKQKRGGFVGVVV